MKKLLYIGKFGLPNMAAGIRVYNLGILFKQLDIETTYICDIPSPIEDKEQIFYKGFNYYFINSKLYKKYSPIDKVKELFTAKDLYDKVKRYCEKEKPEIILLYNDAGPLTKKLIKYCEEKNIILGADVTEWYSLKQKGFTQTMKAFLVNFRIRFLDKKLKFILAVSPFLYSYYKKQEKKVYWVPPLFEYQEKSSKTTSEKGFLNIVYAGMMGKKDILLPLLDVVKIINFKEIKVRLSIAGDISSELEKVWKIKNYDKYGIKLLGYLENEKVKEIILQSDITVLFRKNLKYAKAGFSSKVAEAITLGIPVICNKVGGTDLVIEHLYNGYLINKINEKNILNALNKLLLMSKEEKIEIKENAFKTAQKLFIISKYFEGREYEDSKNNIEIFTLLKKSNKIVEEILQRNGE